MWLSNANSNAIVITDLTAPPATVESLEVLFPAGPVSRAEARSRVRFGLAASCIMLDYGVSKCTKILCREYKREKTSLGKLNMIYTLTLLESSGIIRKPEGKRGASSANEASIGANMSSAQVPIAFSSIPLHS